jgi:hypothetical protein
MNESVIVLKSSGETVFQAKARIPIQSGAYFTVIGVIIPDVYWFSVFRKRNDPILSFSMDFDHESRQVFQVDTFGAAKIVNLAVALLGQGRHEHGIGHIVNVVEIPHLETISPHLNPLTFNKVFDPYPEEGLAGIFHAHSRPKRVGESQGTRSDTINVTVKDVVPLARHFVDAVHIRRMENMALVNREKVGPAINLSGTGIKDFDGGVVVPTRFQDEQLGPAIDVEIHKRIFHGVEMACLAGKVEQIVLTLNQVSHAEFIPNVSNVDANPAFISFQVE